MRETDKAVRRRLYDDAFRGRYLVGDGIDIGSGDTPLSLFKRQFDRMRSVRGWDLADGDAQRMDGVPDESYDFVHSSHCLEHMHDAREALKHWLRILKQGGYLIVTVPDEDLYEHGRWPSPFNADHKWRFTICKPAHADLERSLNVVDLLRDVADIVDCERMTQLRDRYDESAPADMDQTLGEAECAIEWVWRKRGTPPVAARSSAEWLHEGVRAELGDDDDAAETAYREACTHESPALDAFNNLAHLLTRQRRYDEAEALWHHATQRVPGPQARIYQALYLLQRGNFRKGFRIREANIDDARRTPTLPDPAMPRWLGEQLDGRSIVIWTEFGLGDELMFSRFARDLKEQFGAARVSVLCQDPLFRLLENALDGADLVLPVSRRHELPAHDYWVFPHSIPAYRSLTTDSIPGKPYLSPASLARPEPEWFGAGSANLLKVGLVWQGNPTHENDRFRSIETLDVLEGVLSTADVGFVSLQKGPAEQDAILRSKNHALFKVLGHELGDFSDTAAAISALDLVISVDTSVAHLAGAMGRPVWLLLPTACDWRWLLEREDSPWYPSMRIFRQERLGEWGPVLRRVRAELEHFRDDKAHARVVPGRPRRRSGHASASSAR